MSESALPQSIGERKRSVKVKLSNYITGSLEKAGKQIFDNRL